jgi:hypothetical protein
MISVSSWAHSYDIVTHFLYRKYLVAATFDAAPLDPSSKLRLVAKLKYTAVEVPRPAFRLRCKPQDDYESPKNSMIETKPSIASTANSIKFSGERVIRAKHGRSERRSLEATALIADGEEDISTSCELPVYDMFLSRSPRY